MAGSTEILQEYLVKLGFQTDAISLRKFEDSVGKTGKTILKVGIGITAVVAAVEAASAEFAYSMRKVYFQADLAGTSVKNLQSLTFAAEQFGISGDAIGSAVHNLAQAFRLNPALSAYASRLTGINEVGRDTKDVLIDLVKWSKQMPEWQGAQFMQGLFGMDPDTYHLMRSNIDGIIAQQHKMIDLYKSLGIDLDNPATKKALLSYATDLDTLGAHFEGLWASVRIGGAPLFDAMTSSLNRFMDSITRGDIGTVVYNVFGSYFDKLNAAQDLWEKRQRPQIHPITTAGALSAQGRVSGSLADWLHPQIGGARNERNNNPGNMKYGPNAIKWGATGKDSGGFAIFPSMAVGFQAMQNLLGQYGSQGTDTVSGIVSRWAPAKDHNNPVAYANFVAKQMGVTTSQRLNMSDASTRERMASAMSRYEGMNSTRLGGGARSVVVNQTNNTSIKVVGNGAESTGKAVVAAQSRLYGDALRNINTVMQ